MIGNRVGTKRQSTAALRLSAVRATTPRTSVISPDERPGKRARISQMENDGPVTEAKLKADESPLAQAALKPQVRISDVIKVDDPNHIDVTALTKKKVDVATANAKARRKSRSSMGRQSLSRNAVLGNAPRESEHSLPSLMI